MPHEHAHPAEERRALTLRVRKVADQLQAVGKMITEDRDCAEVLTQLVSARQGVKSLVEKLMAMHMHSCIERADNPA